MEGGGRAKRSRKRRKKARNESASIIEKKKLPRSAFGHTRTPTAAAGQHADISSSKCPRSLALKHTAESLMNILGGVFTHVALGGPAKVPAILQFSIERE